MQKRNKLLLGGLSTAAVVTGVALTGGTSAYYYDLERSTGNTLSACSLDLVEDSVAIEQTAYAHDNPATASVETGTLASSSPSSSSPGAGGLSTIKLENLQPGDAFKVTIGLRNDGSCAGEMWGDINFPIKDFEGPGDPNGSSNTEAENEWQALGNNPDDSTQDGSGNPDTDSSDGGQGDLDDVIQVVYSDDEGNSFSGSFHELAYEYPWELDDDFTSGEVNEVEVTLTVPDDDTAGFGNEIMGDSYEFAIDFAAAQKDQIQPQPEGVNVDLNNMGVAP